mmetsp:Transcript_126234/g.327730  ORF Transcript_126234/g.327730 Transcript_126234/m.327730 type:complete len:204 (-) Transcript_126234:636-1247(-)
MTVKMLVECVSCTSSALCLQEPHSAFCRGHCHLHSRRQQQCCNRAAQPPLSIWQPWPGGLWILPSYAAVTCKRRPLAAHLGPPFVAEMSSLPQLTEVLLLLPATILQCWQMNRQHRHVQGEPLTQAWGHRRNSQFFQRTVAKAAPRWRSGQVTLALEEPRLRTQLPQDVAKVKHNLWRYLSSRNIPHPPPPPPLPLRALYLAH